MELKGRKKKEGREGKLVNWIGPKWDNRGEREERATGLLHVELNTILSRLGGSVDTSIHTYIRRYRYH